MSPGAKAIENRNKTTNSEKSERREEVVNDSKTSRDAKSERDVKDTKDTKDSKSDRDIKDSKNSTAKGLTDSKDAKVEKTSWSEAKATTESAPKKSSSAEKNKLNLDIKDKQVQDDNAPDKASQHSISKATETNANSRKGKGDKASEKPEDPAELSKVVIGDRANESSKDKDDSIQQQLNGDSTAATAPDVKPKKDKEKKEKKHKKEKKEKKEKSKDKANKDD